MTSSTPKILIIRLSAIGDIFHALTLLSDIRKHLPNAQIDWLVDEKFADIVKMSPLVDNVLSLPFKKFTKDKWSLLKNLTIWRKQYATTQYDYVIDTHGLIKTALLTKMFHGAKYGLDRHSAREGLLPSLFYDYKFNVSQDNVAVIRFRGLLQKIFNWSGSLNVFNFELNTVASNYSENVNGYTLLLHGTSRKNKEWSIDNWTALSKWLLVNSKQDVYITYSNEYEQNVVMSLANKVNSSRFKVIPKLAFAEIMDVVKHADLVVGVDTGFSHLANLFKRKMIGLYLQTNSAYVGLVASDIAYNLGGKNQQVSVDAVIQLIKNKGLIIR